MPGSGLGDAHPTAAAPVLLLCLLQAAYILPLVQDDTLVCPAPIYKPHLIPALIPLQLTSGFYKNGVPKLFQLLVGGGE